MNLRTDLALEAVDFAGNLSHADCQKTTTARNGITVTTLYIRTRHAAECIGKPIGTYTTLELPPLTDDEKFLNEGAAVVAEILCKLLPKEGTVLTVGLGNRAITPDALGPKTADMVLATRHIQGEFARSVGLDDLRPSAVVIPGVLGQTGTESSEAVAVFAGWCAPRRWWLWTRWRQATCIVWDAPYRCPTPASPPVRGWATTVYRSIPKRSGCR